MGNDGTLRVKVVGDVGDFQKKMTDGGSALGKFGGIAEDVAKRGFGALTSGAEDMQRAQGGFIAATGRSAAEARAFGNDMNGLVGNNNAVGRSFDEITGTGTKVAQQFGLTGAAGTKLTDQFLAFSKAAGTDAAGAVDAFDATLDAWHLPAEAAAGLMDQLIASHQKYGTDAGPAALGVLQAMAPALQTMGADLDDGIGLLNLFEQGGLDASAAQAGLKKAIADLKPGQTLDDLIAQIGAIEDPTLRAQEAISIFGSKAGAGLANVITPGMTSLADYKVSVEDAQGATQKASDALTTDADKIKGAFEKLTAGARTLGQDFGPALMGLQSVSGMLGPLAGKFLGLAKDLAAKLLPQAVVSGASAGLAQGEAQAAAATGPGILRSFLTKIGLMTPALVGAATAQGTAIGAAQGTAIAAASAGPAATGAAAAAGLGLASTIGLAAAAFFATSPLLPMTLEKLTGQDPSSRLAAAGRELASHLIAGQSEEIKATYAQKFFEASNAALEGRSNWDKLFNNGTQAAIDSGVVAANEYATSLGIQVGVAVPNALQNQVGNGRAAYESYMVQLNAKAAEVAALGGHDSVVAMTSAERQALNESRSERMAAHLEVVHETMLAVHAEAAWGGATTPGEFSQGLRSAFDTVRTAFTDLKDLMANTLSPIKQEAELIAIATSQRMAQALADGRPEVRGEAQQIALDSIAQLHKLDATSPEIGKLAMKLLAGATEAEKPAIRDALDTILGVFTSEQNTNYVQQGGTNIAGAWRRAVINELGSNATKSQIGAAVRSAMGATHGESPPKEGPLQNIDRWGSNIAAAWVGGVIGRLRSGVSEIHGVLAAVGGGLGNLVGPPGMALSGAGGGSYAGAPITVNAYGADDVENQIRRALRRDQLRGSLQITPGFGNERI